MKIKLTIKDRVLTATLQENKTAQDFVSLLPLTLTMNDLFGREKFGHLPRAISEGGKRTDSYEVGQIVYWSPGPDVAIFYRNDGHYTEGTLLNGLWKRPGLSPRDRSSAVHNRSAFP